MGVVAAGNLQTRHDFHQLTVRASLELVDEVELRSSFREVTYSWEVECQAWSARKGLGEVVPLEASKRGARRRHRRLCELQSKVSERVKELKVINMNPQVDLDSLCSKTRET